MEEEIFSYNDRTFTFEEILDIFSKFKKLDPTAYMTIGPSGIELSVNGNIYLFT